MSTPRSPPTTLRCCSSWRPTGPPVGDTDVGLADDELRELLRLMVLARRLDRECMALQRQGELTVYPPLRGPGGRAGRQRVRARPDDFVFPSFRELAAALVRGVDAVEYLRYHRGDLARRSVGRSGRDRGSRPICVPVATQLVHAVGLGARREARRHRGVRARVLRRRRDLRGRLPRGREPRRRVRKLPRRHLLPEQRVGDHGAGGATVRRRRSWSAPRGYGIAGRARGRQRRARRYAERPTRRSSARAPAAGPTLVEAMTYRIGPHSTTDDAARYRSEDEVEALARARPDRRGIATFLARRGRRRRAFVAACDDEAETRLAERCAPRLDRAPRPPAAGGCSPTCTAIRRRRSCASATRRSGPIVTEHHDGAGAERGAPRRARRRRPRAGIRGGRRPRGRRLRRDGGPQEEFGEQRVFDTPVAEAGFVGASIGLAIGGFRPVVELQFDGFGYPALEQVISTSRSTATGPAARARCPS